MNSFRRSDGGEGIQRVDVIIRNVSLCAFLPRAHGDCRVSVVRVWEMHCGFTKAVHIRHQPRAQFTESCRLRWVLNPTRPRINITDQGGDRMQWVYPDNWRRRIQLFHQSTPETPISNVQWNASIHKKNRDSHVFPTTSALEISH